MRGGQFETLDTIARRFKREGHTMTDQALATKAPPRELPSPEVISRVLLGGDLSELSPAQRISYYRAVCDSLGLNPLTMPFKFLRLSGKEVLYALRNATDQLRNLYGISVEITSREVVEDTYVVTARATLPNGRHDESIGAVPIAALTGESRSNALMKCETKAKRRVTLSLVGLSTLDESEVESIPDAAPMSFNVETGTVKTDPPAPARTSRVPAGPGAEGAPAAPADLNLPIPEAWQPFALPKVESNRLHGRVAKVDDEVKTNKAGKVFTKRTVTLDTGEVVTTLDKDLAAKCSVYMVNQWLAEILVKPTRWGNDILTIARVPEAGDDAAF
jgi:hypothetical protein